MANLRFGVIGLGRAGSGMLNALARHPDIDVTAAADLHAPHRDRFAREFEGETFADGADLCASKRVDVVYIASPHQYHAEHVLAAAAHGKHIVVEKPMALTLDDCDRMIEAVECTGVTMVVGHTASYNPAIQKMRDLVVDGTVGRLGAISANAFTDFLYRPRRPEELDTALGGGIIFNQVPHQVDATRLIAGGMVRSVRAATWVLDVARPTEGSYTAFLDFENGAAASLTYSGYDHLNTTDIVTGRPPREASSYGAIRRELARVQSQEEETALRISTGFGGEHPITEQRQRQGTGLSLLQGELGVFLVNGEHADLRLVPEGVLAYTTAGLKLIEPNPWRGIPGRGNVIDELYYAVTARRPVVHDGRWAKATLEVCLGFLQSAHERREIPMRFQVPTRDVVS